MLEESKSMSNVQKIAPWMFIIIGFSCMATLIFDYESLVSHDASNFITKYLLIIILANGSITMPAIGYLYLTGKVRPLDTPGMSEIDKARINVYFAIGLIPLYFCLITIFITTALSNEVFILGCCVLIYLGYSFIRDALLLINARHK